MRERESVIILHTFNGVPTDPVNIDTGIAVTHIKWNPTGSILAIAGTQALTGAAGEKEINVVQFYSPFGEVRNNQLNQTVIHVLWAQYIDQHKLFWDGIS